MIFSFNPDLIICRNCQEEVVWSDYATKCVNCKTPNWAYQNEELALASTEKNTPPLFLTTVICKICGTANGQLEKLHCVQCQTLNWGYNYFELRYGLLTSPSMDRSQQKPEPTPKSRNIGIDAFVPPVPGGTIVTPGPVSYPGSTERSDVRPNRKFVAITIGLGIIIGLMINFLLAYLSYQQYRQTILESSAFITTFVNDPVLNRRFFHADSELPPVSEPDFNWRLLVNIGVLDWRSSKEDISPRLDKALDKLKNKSINLSQETSLEVLCLVLESLGRAENAGLENASFIKRKEILATCLSGGPDAHHLMDEFAAPPPVLAGFSAMPQFFLPVNVWAEKISIQEILSRLIADTHADEPFKNLLANKDANNPLDLKDEYAQINDFLMRFIIGIHDDPKVKSARNTFMILVGIEQYFMYIIFGIGLMILFRNKRNRVSEGDRRFSVVMYKWIYIALPSLGFIGTKRGLSKALSGADSIVRANTEVNQSLAISDVSDTMGIAFTSTLVGLVLLMILMLGELIKRYKYLNWDE